MRKKSGKAKEKVLCFRIGESLFEEFRKITSVLGIPPSKVLSSLLFSFVSDPSPSILFDSVLSPIPKKQLEIIPSEEIEDEVRKVLSFKEGNATATIMFFVEFKGGQPVKEHQDKRLALVIIRVGGVSFSCTPLSFFALTRVIEEARIKNISTRGGWEILFFERDGIVRVGKGGVSVNLTKEQFADFESIVIRIFNREDVQRDITWFAIRFQ